MAALAQLPQPLAAVLWGGQARKKAAVIKNSVYPRLVIESAHPSPLSSYRGFFGSRPFSRINAFLTENGEEPIRWEV
jgi:uracil-DNA glycosylase